MAQQIIDIGSVANDGQGDTLRVAFEKTNENFTELFNVGGITGIANGTSNIQIVNNSTVSTSSAGVANVFVVSGTGATVQGLLTANAQISATGNITAAGFFVGNGSLLTGVVASAPASQITGTTLSSNVINSSLQTVGTLTSLSVSGNVTGGNVNSSGVVSASGNILGLNLNTGGVVSAAGNVTGGNLTTLGIVSTVGGVNTPANVTAAFFIGDGGLLSNVAGGGTSNAALLTGSTLSANVVNSSLQTVGNLQSLVVSNALGGTGNVSANNVSIEASASVTGNVTGGNIISLGVVSAVTVSAVGQITGDNVIANTSAGTVAGNVIAATSLMTTGRLSATGNITAVGNISTGNLSASGNVTAQFLLGNISGPQTNITEVGTLGNLSVTSNISGGNITSGGIITATGNITGGNIISGAAVSAATVTGSGNIVAGNFSTAGNVIAAQNVNAGNMSVSGTVTSAALSVAGNTVVSGNLTVTGTTSYTNVDTMAISDPIIGIGRGANNTPLGSSDGKDRGEQLWYFNSGERSAFIGWQSSSGKLLAAANVSISSEVVTVNSFGTLVVGTLEGTTASLTGTVTAGNIVTGGLATVTGNITAGNIIAAGVGQISTAGNVSGANVRSGVLITNIGSAGNAIDNGGSNATGNIGSATTYFNTAFLTALTAAGNVTAGLITATGNITGGNINTAGTITATGNIRAGNISAVGNIASGNASFVNLATTDVNAVANVTGQNIISNAIVTAVGNIVTTSGNIRGGNVISTALVQGVGLSITGNVATVTSANYQIGYLNLPQVVFGAGATLALTDSGKHYYSTQALPQTLTIPSNANVGFDVGAAVSIVNQGAGTMTITGQAGVSLFYAGNSTASSRTLSSFGMATLIKVATNTWFINGTGVT